MRCAADRGRLAGRDQILRADSMDDAVRAAAAGATGRCRAAVAGLRQLRYVQRLRSSWRDVHRCCAEILNASGQHSQHPAGPRAARKCIAGHGAALPAAGSAVDGRGCDVVGARLGDGDLGLDHQRRHVNIGDPFYYGLRQGIYLLAGIGIGMLVLRCVWHIGRAPVCRC